MEDHVSLMPDDLQAANIETADGHIKHLVDAIATGKASDAVSMELQREDARSRHWRRQLQQADQLSRVSSLYAKRIERHLTERAGELTRMPESTSPNAANRRKLIPPTLLVGGKRVPAGSSAHRSIMAWARGYAFVMNGSYARLLGAGVAVIRRWWRGRQSNRRWHLCSTLKFKGWLWRPKAPPAGCSELSLLPLRQPNPTRNHNSGYTDGGYMGRFVLSW